MGLLFNVLQLSLIFSMKQFGNRLQIVPYYTLRVSQVHAHTLLVAYLW